MDQPTRYLYLIDATGRRAVGWPGRRRPRAVMRGGGRMRDAGFEIVWGPGRHGPGNNAFNYFVGPFGEVIEYTAEVEQIDHHYVVGGPSDWTWPPGRVDQWGVSAPPGETLKSAQRNVFFIPA